MGEAPSAVVDVHCHTFNGDDLPIAGFVHRVLLHNLGVLRLVSRVLDLVGQAGTPGYEAERSRLDRLLGYEAPGLAPAAFVGEPSFDEVVDQTYRTIRTENPELLVEAERDLAAMEGAPAPGPAALSPIGGFLAAKRAIAWAVLLRRSRLDITRRLLATYPEVDLFTPMTVDMAVGLRDQPEVTLLQQLELHEKISRLGMVGRLRDGAPAHVHPFVGFDPRSEYRSRKAGDVLSALEIVQLAVQRFGFIGVKLYPPMGFRPTGNVPNSEMDAEQASAVDSILEELYTWCEREDVPVTAHCSASNEARRDYRLFSSPELWGKVLAAHPGLRLNLGHFGGASEDPADPAARWPAEIAVLANQRPHIYADTGNHRIDDDEIATSYFAKLHRLFEAIETARIKDRLMYGSDWLMLALLPRSEGFLHTYRDLYDKHFGAEATSRFMGGTALEFLGLSDPTNKNRLRLVDRYSAVRAALPPWLGDAGDAGAT
jgi:predicted TIM-barrel fold metal-dependent hydrolase